ncbi:MAG: hypothetical protein ACI9SE_004463 [Neolewinella sp.]
MDGKTSVVIKRLIALGIGVASLALIFDLLPDRWVTGVLVFVVGWMTCMWWVTIIGQIVWPRPTALRKQLRIRAIGQGRFTIRGSFGAVVVGLVFLVAARFTEHSVFWSIAAGCAALAAAMLFFSGRAILRDPDRAPILPDLTPADLDRAAARNNRALPALIFLQVLWAASWLPLTT